VFLSKITVQPRQISKSAYFEALAGGPYKLHQLIWQLFSDDTERKHLFREEQGAGGMPVIYTLSDGPPAATHPVFCVQTKKFEPRLERGMRLGYSLRLNPTVDKHGKKHDVLMNAKRDAKTMGLAPLAIAERMDVAVQEWFGMPERATRWGISLDYLPQVDGYTQHKTRRKTGVISFSSIDLQGILTVQEPELFLARVRTGFGRAKAFGCGLMLIRRV